MLVDMERVLQLQHQLAVQLAWAPASCNLVSHRRPLVPDIPRSGLASLNYEASGDAKSEVLDQKQGSTQHSCNATMQQPCTQAGRI